MQYYTKKEMEEMYPDGNYRILGELSEKRGTHQGQPVYDEVGNPIYVQPSGTYKNSIYKSDGYLWNEAAQAFISVKKKSWLSIFLYGVAAAGLVVGIGFGANQFFNGSKIDPNAQTFESTVKRSEDMDESRILVPGYNDWNMVAGTDEISVALYNPDKNPCYFQFSIVLDETQEVLYKTGLIPPGQAVTTVKLPRTFEKGTYPITINIGSYSLEDESQRLNGGEVKTNINAMEQ